MKCCSTYVYRIDNKISETMKLNLKKKVQSNNWKKKKKKENMD